MNDQYFVMYKGVKTGPFTGEELKRRVREGLISRFHQISTDDSTWQAAQHLEDLWRDRPVDVEALEVDDDHVESNLPTEEELPVAEVASQDTAQQQNSTMWHFVAGGESCGPVSQNQLIAMISAGQITPQTLVWTDVFTDWYPANQINILQPYF